jgi:hypothetical protein
MKNPKAIRDLLLAPLFIAVITSISSCSTSTLDPRGFASEASKAAKDESRLEGSLKELCERSGAEYCEKLAQVFLENGKIDLAEKAAATGCARERISSCALQGEILLSQGETEKALPLLSSSCESKTALDGAACTGAGEAAYLANDPRKAQALWKRGCQAGDLESCRFHGKALRISNRVQESMLPLSKACDGGIVGACSELGISLALNGKIEAAAEKFSTDCDRRSQRACRWLPILEEKLKNKTLEKTLDQDCRSNNSLEACYDSIALQFFRKGGRRLALHRWKENCKAGHKMSCWESFLEENSLRPMSHLSSELDRFCEDSILVACYYKGIHHSERGHKDKALSAWISACDKGEAWSCSLAAESGLLASSEEATKLREKACSLGLQRSCAEGQAAENAVEMSVKSDKNPAPDFPSACANGDSDACAYLGRKKAKESDKGYEDEEAKDKFRKACLASSTLGCEGLVRGLPKR